MLHVAGWSSLSLLGCAAAAAMLWQDPAVEERAAQEAAIAAAHAEQAQQQEVAARARYGAAIAAAAQDAAAQSRDITTRVRVRQSGQQPGGAIVYGEQAGAAEEFLRAYNVYAKQPESSDVARAVHAYRSADSEDGRTSARKQLSDALGAEYDALLQQHEQHLNQMEERLRKLRDQLAKRREARDDMVSMRLQWMLSEADGLGWPSAPRPGSDWSASSPTQAAAGLYFAPQPPHLPFVNEGPSSLVPSVPGVAAPLPVSAQTAPAPVAPAVPPGPGSGQGQ